MSQTKKQSLIETVTNIVTEDKGHLDHPEDLIFLRGAQGANQAIQAMSDTCLLYTSDAADE